MLHSGRTIRLAGDDVRVFLSAARFSISEAPETRGLPRFNDVARRLPALDLDDDAVLVAVALGDEEVDPVFQKLRNVHVTKIQQLMEARYPDDEEIELDEDRPVWTAAPTLAELCPDLKLDQSQPEKMRLHVYSPTSVRRATSSDTIHVNLHGDEPVLSAEERVLQTVLAVNTSDVADRLEDEDGGAPRDALAGTALAAPPRVPTELPIELTAMKRLLDADTKLDHEHVVTRGDRRKRHDRRVEEARQFLFIGPKAVTAGDPEDAHRSTDRICTEEEKLLLAIDDLLRKNSTVDSMRQKAIDEKSVLVTDAAVRTLKGSRQQLESLDRRIGIYTAEKARLGREIQDLQLKRAALRRQRLTEDAEEALEEVVVVDEDEDESGEPGDDDAHVNVDPGYVVSDEEGEGEGEGVDQVEQPDVDMG